MEMICETITPYTFLFPFMLNTVWKYITTQQLSWTFPSCVCSVEVTSIFLLGQSSWLLIILIALYPFVKAM